MSKTVDAIDAIAVGLAALGMTSEGGRLHARSQAGLIAKSLNEFGFVIVPKELVELAATSLALSGYTSDGELADELRTMLAAASPPPQEGK